MSGNLPEPFRSGIEVREFRLPACGACGCRFLPPGRTCPRCLSDDVSWQPASGQGTVVASCEFHKGYFSDLPLTLPYTVLLVRLAEGPLFYANPADPGAAPSVGSSVRAVFVQDQAGRTVLRFAPAGCAKGEQP